MLNWNSVDLTSRKSYTFKVKVNVDNCAPARLAFRALVVGGTCNVDAEPMYANVKRSKKSKTCAPTKAPTTSGGVFGSGAGGGAGAKGEKSFCQMRDQIMGHQGRGEGKQAYDNAELRAHDAIMWGGRKCAFGLVVELVLERLHDRSGRFRCACTNVMRA